MWLRRLLELVIKIVDSDKQEPAQACASQRQSANRMRGTIYIRTGTIRILSDMRRNINDSFDGDIIMIVSIMLYMLYTNISMANP